MTTKFGHRFFRRHLAGLVGISGMVVVYVVLTQAVLQMPHQQTHSGKMAHKVAQKIPQAPPFTFLAGGRSLLPNYRLVALYGTPSYPALGALGEQPPEIAAQRAKALAAEYQPYTAEHILPTFEIITTVAAASPTENGDYSQELPPSSLQPWIDAARQAGVYVVLDLQPGRSDFLTQAKQYEALLREPHVGLALDPEWRLTPTQLPLEQIGSVSIDEVNRTAQWLATLVAQQRLPQKLFLLHQFRLTMLPQRELLNTAFQKELAYVIQMDGQGTQAAKADTWRALTANPPPLVEFGWKNFYHQDMPLLDPAATMRLVPQPRYISYQ